MSKIALTAFAVTLTMVVAAPLESAAVSPPGVSGAPVAIIDTAVLDAARGRLIPHQTVLIRQGRIVAVTSAATARIPSGAIRIAGAGKTLMPGLWDMHTHLGASGDCSLPTLVRYGVTNIRDMGSSIDKLHRWQKAIAAGAIVGPDMKVSGPIVEDQDWLDWVHGIDAKNPVPEIIATFAESPRVGVKTPKDAVAAVRHIKALGADFIKMRNLEGPSYRALLTEARREGITVAGHAPGGSAMNKDYFDPAMRDRIGTAGRGMATIEHIGTLRAQMGSLTADQKRQVVRQMALDGTMLTPTVGAMSWRLADIGDLRKVISDDSGRLEPDLSPTLRRSWKAGFEMEEDGLADRAKWQSAVNEAIAIGVQAHDMGVPLLAGTDLSVPTSIPGKSLLDEIELMARTLKLSTAEALRAAVWNPARLFHLESSYGSVAPGRVANLLLIDGNPLANLANLRRTDTVFLHGKAFDTVALNRLRDEVRRRNMAGQACLAS